MFPRGNHRQAGFDGVSFYNPQGGTMRRILMLAAALMVCLLSVSAEAAMVQYMSQHPMPRRMGGGFCYIDVPHVHDFGPSDPRMYRQVDGQYYFVGDPAPFGYDGPRHAFYGPHPIVEANVQFGQPEYCYLQGPHYHWYEPPPEASFELKGGVYWYTGSYDPVFYRDQPRYVVVNDAYAPIVYTRPVVDIAIAPPAFHAEFLVGGPAWRGRVVAAPPPVVQVGVGVGVGVGGPPPGAVYYEHDHGRHRGWDGDDDDQGHHRGWDHHDNGLHRGWDKHEGGGWREPPPERGGWRAPPPERANWRGAPAPAQGGGGGWRASAPPAPGGGHGGPPPGHGGGKPGWKR
jgi:hypothetical protein